MSDANEDVRQLRLPGAVYEGLLDGMQEGLFVVEGQRFIFANAALGRMVGGAPADMIGQVFTERIAPEDRELVVTRYRRRLAGEDVAGNYEFSILHLDGETRISCFMNAFTIAGPRGPLGAGTLTPLALRAAFVASQTENVAVQGRAAEEEGGELAIPVLQLHARALGVPIVGHLNAARAGRVMDHLLAEIARHGAREVILDITGLPVVDERVANYLVRTARAVQLLGARLTLAGISPAIAQTLVTLGISLQELDCTRSLEDAWRAASGRLGGRSHRGGSTSLHIEDR